MRERLLEPDKQRIKRELEAALVKELVKRNAFPIAPALVDRHAEGIVARARHAADDDGPRRRSRSTPRR